jgi:hypothetical protein
VTWGCSEVPCGAWQLTNQIISRIGWDNFSGSSCTRDLHVREGHRKYATFEIVSLHTASPVGFCQLVGFAGGLESRGNLLLVYFIPSVRYDDTFLLLGNF